MEIRCYVREGAVLDIRPASPRRGWMDETPYQHAYRCLPLAVANSLGWTLHCKQPFTATWAGGPLQSDLAFAFEGDPPDGFPPALSAFGSGIVTFHVPCLFRTPRGVDLLVLGPLNHVKDGIQALSGVVETDWLTEYGFTMNWKITRPETGIRFEAGEPFCQILPVPRGYAEGFTPTLHRFAEDPALREDYYGAEERRRTFQQDLGVQQRGDAMRPGDQQTRQWQRRYFSGIDSQGRAVEDHRTKLRILPFRWSGAEE